MLLIIACIVAGLVLLFIAGGVYELTRVGEAVDRCLAGRRVAPSDEIGELAETIWPFPKRDEVAS